MAGGLEVATLLFARRWSKRPKDCEVLRYDEAVAQWVSVRNFTYPKHGSCGDGISTFGGQECSCCGPGKNQKAYLSVDLDGVLARKLRLKAGASVEKHQGWHAMTGGACKDQPVCT